MVSFKNYADKCFNEIPQSHISYKHFEKQLQGVLHYNVDNPLIKFMIDIGVQYEQRKYTDFKLVRTLEIITVNYKLN